MSLTPEQAAELAAAPQVTSVDGQQVTERSAEDLIKLDAFAAGKAAVSPTAPKRKNPFQLLRTVALCPPGSV